MKKLLTLTAFFSAMLLAGSLSAQDRVSKSGTSASDTSKVKAAQDTTKPKKDKKKPAEDKSGQKKEEMKGSGSETDRMAIDELGMPVDKKDKKKKVTKTGDASGTKKD
jgi:hypothetical protein